MAKKNEEIAQDTALTVQQNAVALGHAQFEEDAGQGSQFEMSELQTPYITIIQANSPELLRGDAKYIKGAKSGDIMQTISRDIIDAEDEENGFIDVISCGHMRMFVEWTPRDSGGGFVANHMENSPVVRRAMKNGWKTPEGTMIRETVYYPCYVNWRGDWMSAIISLASTGLRESRQWNSMVQNIKFQGSRGLYTPPCYSHIYRLRTGPKKNKKGNWMGWEITNNGPINMDDPFQNELYNRAKIVYKMIQEGALQLGPPPVSSEDEEEVPFG